MNPESENSSHDSTELSDAKMLIILSLTVIHVLLAIVAGWHLVAYPPKQMPELPPDDGFPMSLPVPPIPATR